MPAITDRVNLFQKRQELHQFLFSCQQRAIDKNCSQIASISFEIQSVNPLDVLQAINQPNQRHFYFEQRAQSKVIAANAVTTETQIEGPQRFVQAKKFIQSCLANSISVGELHLPFTGPHFFCSFTFFDWSRDTAFPAATVFLPRWHVARASNCSVAVANVQVGSESDLQRLCAELWHDWQAIRCVQTNSSKVTTHKGYLQEHVTNTDDFKASVLSALSSIKEGDLQKIVLAHAVDVSSPVPFDLFQTLQTLGLRHPECYVFSTSNGQQSFIGASPERLLTLHNQQLATDALAGSAPRGKTATEDAYFAHGLLSSAKERREHRAVTDFIVQCLSRLGIAPQLPPLPYLLQLANIQHLQTPIRATVPTHLHLFDLLAQLHPTPAVAGVPRDLAEAQIQKYETFERSLYAAPVGWVDHQGNGEFAVGIRSALIDGSHARLYAGAGVVAGSDPAKELAEVILKFQTLLEALR